MPNYKKLIYTRAEADALLALEIKLAYLIGILNTYIPVHITAI
jgi:hypothetical protein